METWDCSAPPASGGLTRINCSCTLTLNQFLDSFGNSDGPQLYLQEILHYLCLESSPHCWHSFSVSSSSLWSGLAWATKELPGKLITGHACLHASTNRSSVGCPPCEAVAKLRPGNRFSVAKLVTWEVEKVMYYSHSSWCKRIICEQTEVNGLNTFH